MASSRNSSSSRLPDAVAEALQSVLWSGARVLVGLSGGVDSVSLLTILAELAGLAAPMRFSLRALHVHHGISPNASQWAAFCEKLCAGLSVPLQVERVQPEAWRALGVEAAARRVRYEVFARQEADIIALAHHRDDQAETLLLQLMRGAGPLGMGGMPAVRGLAGSAAVILRPLLSLSRADIEAWARERGLDWIGDESNDDLARRRNFMRHRVLPLLEQQFPAARATVARAAAHLAEAGTLLSALGQIDLAALGPGPEIEVAGLRALGPARARNALRSLCQARGIPLPTAAMAEEIYRQLLEAHEDRTVLVEFQGWQFRRYRGRLYVERAHSPVGAAFHRVWSGEDELPLHDLGGVLRFRPEEGSGLSAKMLRRGEVSVRLRAGGERLQPEGGRPRRTLKNLLQERGVPPWRRGRWPLLYCGEALVSVPGIGEDCAWRAQPSEPGLIVSWDPLERA